MILVTFRRMNARALVFLISLAVPTGAQSQSPFESAPGLAPAAKPVAHTARV
jgi:hypothetical protein